MIFIYLHALVNQQKEESIMGVKKGIGSLLGFTAVVGAVALAVKYLVDYTDFKEKAKEDFHDIEGDSGEVKEAAKRTYTSLNFKDTAELKNAAKDLAGAAGRVAVDAGSITVAAGKSAAGHVKDTYSKFKEDPDSAKAEVMGNIKFAAKDMFSDIKGSVSDKFGALTETVSGLKDEYKKNLEEIEAEAEEKKRAIDEKLTADLSEEAEKHSHTVDEEDSLEDECLFAAEPEEDEDIDSDNGSSEIKITEE